MNASLSPSRAPIATAHIPALDGLRAIAVLCVVYHHWIDPDTRMQLGAIGVKLFFVLSGFLITRILLNSRLSSGRPLGEKLTTFFIRRTLRIFPLYYAVLAVAAIKSPWLRELWPWYVAYLQNVAMMKAGRFLFAPHFWTLAIEEQFYLAWVSRIRRSDDVKSAARIAKRA